MVTKERKTDFIKWYAWSMQNGDCDPALWMMNYLNKRYEHNDEERLWFAWLYHTYNLPTAWVYKQEFPDEELASVERFTVWNDENYKRLRYQTDTKWSKGHLPAMYASYHEWVGDKTQQESFDTLPEDPTDKFEALWKIVKSKWYKFGRYTAFFYLQTLKHTAGVNLNCPTLFLSDYSGSKSHRNGLCYVAGKDDWVNEKLSTDQYQWLEDFGAEVLEETQLIVPEADNFSMETALCSFKKLFRTKRGRYMGYYLDRQSEEIMKAEADGWNGIEWEVLWQARVEMLNGQIAPRYAKEDKSKMSLYLEEGGFHYDQQL